MSNPAKKVRKPKSTIKAINIRMSHDIWYFMKQRSLDQEISFNEIVNQLLTKYKEKFEKHA